MKTHKHTRMHCLPHPIQETEATQIACRIAERYGGSINYYRLMKLLYLVEREAWINLGQPAMGGTYFNLEDGPMISEAADAVTAQALGTWTRHLSSEPFKKGTAVVVTHSAGRDHVSDAVLEIVDKVVQATRNLSNDQLKDEVHKLGEFKKPAPGKRLPLTAEQILAAGGVNPKRTAKLQEEANAWAKLEAALS